MLTHTQVRRCAWAVLYSWVTVAKCDLLSENPTSLHFSQTCFHDYYLEGKTNGLLKLENKTINFYSVHVGKKFTGALLIDYNKEAVEMGLGLLSSREMGQLVRYSFKSTSTHRFKQEGCSSSGVYSIFYHNVNCSYHFFNGTETKQRYLCSPLSKESLYHAT